MVNQVGVRNANINIIIKDEFLILTFYRKDANKDIDIIQDTRRK